MKYVVEWGGRTGDPVQVEVDDADSEMDAIEKAMRQSSRKPEPADIEGESSYDGWKRVEFNLLPGGFPVDTSYDVVELDPKDGADIGHFGSFDSDGEAVEACADWKNDDGDETGLPVWLQVRHIEDGCNLAVVAEYNKPEKVRSA